MRNSYTILLSLFLGTAVIAGAVGCGDSKDPTGASAAPVTTTITSSTSTETPKPAGTATSSTTPAATTSPASEAGQSTQASTTPPAAEPAPATPVAGDKGESADTAKPGEKVAVIETNLGEIVFKFFPSKAPKTVANFEKLASSKFYDGTKFHRVIPGFMIQGGDPNTKPGGEANGPAGTGGPGYSVKAEFNDTHHGRGIVSMARSQDPDSAGSQFFICVADANSLDGQYTAFGKVVKGMDVVDKIVNLPTGQTQPDMPNPGSEAVMKTVRIATWPVK